MDMHTKKIEKQKVSENTSKWCKLLAVKLCLILDLCYISEVSFILF